jgi:hypothetical protein
MSSYMGGFVIIAAVVIGAITFDPFLLRVGLAPYIAIELAGCFVGLFGLSVWWVMMVICQLGVVYDANMRAQWHRETQLLGQMEKLREHISALERKGRKHR